MFEVLVAGLRGPDGGAPLFHLSRLASGWTTATRRPEMTLEPLSLDVVAWDDQRFDYVYLGACGTSRRTTCQHFWQGGFSGAFDLGLPPDGDGGVTTFASALTSPSRTRLTLYALATTGELYRSAWLGASWSGWSSERWSPLLTLDLPMGASVVDGFSSSDAVGNEARTSLVGHEPAGPLFMTRTPPDFFGFSAVWAPWRMAPRAPPAGVQLQVRASVAQLPDAGPVWVEMVSSGVLVTERVVSVTGAPFSSGQGWFPVPPAPV
ncbi:MAG: hypothetical protein MUC96_08640, partial [Myxococcaceae bacterium]|nr:hypothetical protein [Myxococcaceae bacterium]